MSPLLLPHHIYLTFLSLHFQQCQITDSSSWRKMGNCFVLSKPTTASCIADDVVPKHGKVLQVVKTDGKVLEFRAPILVKDALYNFPNSVVAVSRQFSEHLPSNYELKLGKVYYMVPYLGSGTVKEGAAFATTRRIKIVITKQQLQEFLANQIPAVPSPKIQPCNSIDDDSLTTWKPKLQCIPEEASTESM